MKLHAPVAQNPAAAATTAGSLGGGGGGNRGHTTRSDHCVGLRLRQGVSSSSSRSRGHSAGGGGDGGWTGIPAPPGTPQAARLPAVEPLDCARNEVSGRAQRTRRSCCTQWDSMSSTTFVCVSNGGAHVSQQPVSAFPRSTSFVPKVFQDPPLPD